MSSAYRPPAFAAPIDLDLSRNEGSPSITEIDLDPAELAAATSRYPDTTRLRDVVAERHQVPPDRVLPTAGGDDALLRCFLANRSRAAVASTPSFEMIRRYAAQVGTPLIEVPWWSGDFPIDDFLDESAGGPGMAIVVSPNNPTGNVVARADLRKLADAYRLVVLDAAYVEFADDDPTTEALDLENVVVIRTLSKAFGLAGLRVGYLLGSSERVRELAAFGSPYSMSGLSASLAADVLAAGAVSGVDQTGAVASGREQLTALFDDLRCRPLPSQANFVLATDVDPSWVVPAAASLGVGLRRFGDRPDLARCVRVTVPADRDDLGRLLDTLRTVLAPEALLFDMDGVLVDVSESYRAAIVATAATFGVEVTDQDIDVAKARGNASDDWDLTRRLCAEAGVDSPLEEVRARFERIYQGDPGEGGLKARERWLADTERLVAWSRRIPLGIVTARPRQDAIEALERFGVAAHFSTVVAREDAPAKPDPAPVRMALERLGVSRAWMVGDTVDDLNAARSAGVAPIGVVPAGGDSSPLSAAARVLESVDEIEEVLDVTVR